MVVHITDKLAKTAICTDKPQFIHYDDEIKGFGLRVTNNGSKAFILNYSVNKLERRYTIGKYPDWSVAAARDRAKQLKREIDTGIDPQGKKEAARNAETIKDLFKEYSKSHLIHLEERNRKDIQSMWQKYILPEFGNKRVKDLDSRDIDRLHNLIPLKNVDPLKPDKGKVRANRVIANLRSVLNLALRWGIIDKNPAIGLKKNKEHGKNRYLKAEEVSVVFDKLSLMPNKQAANVIRLLIFTGARLGEVTNLEWVHLDLEKGVWTKPASKTKQKRIHTVPLSVEANTLLQSMLAEAVQIAVKANKPASPFVFPSRTGKPIPDIKKPWLWLLEEAKLQQVRVHDLRHTFASLLISGGESLPVIGRLLGHSQQQTTARYAQLMDDPLRTATNRIFSLVNGDKHKADKEKARND